MNDSDLYTSAKCQPTIFIPTFTFVNLYSIPEHWWGLYAVLFFEISISDSNPCCFGLQIPSGSTFMFVGMKWMIQGDTLLKDFQSNYIFSEPPLSISWACWWVVDVPLFFDSSISALNQCNVDIQGHLWTFAHFIMCYLTHVSGLTCWC